MALAGLTWMLERVLRLPPPLAAAIVGMGSIAWLTWPLWLRPADPAWLVAVHPALTLNGILTATPPWTEQAIAYHLTALNQDVPIALPHSPWPCAILQSLIAAPMLLFEVTRRGELALPVPSPAE